MVTRFFEPAPKVLGNWNVLDTGVVAVVPAEEPMNSPFNQTENAEDMPPCT